MELIKYSLVYTADSIRTFDSKSNRTADLIRDSIRTQKKLFAGPYLICSNVIFVIATVIVNENVLFSLTVQFSVWLSLTIKHYRSDLIPMIENHGRLPQK